MTTIYNGIQTIVWTEREKKMNKFTGSKNQVQNKMNQAFKIFLVETRLYECKAVELSGLSAIMLK